MTHPWVMENNCVKYYSDPIWQWGVMARTQILGTCALGPWPWRNDLGSRSWHTLGSWTTIVWNIIPIGQVVRIYSRDTMWTDRRTDRQTDRQGDSYIPRKLCLQGHNKYSAHSPVKLLLQSIHPILVHDITLIKIIYTKDYIINWSPRSKTEWEYFRLSNKTDLLLM